MIIPRVEAKEGRLLTSYTVFKEGLFRSAIADDCEL